MIKITSLCWMMGSLSVLNAVPAYLDQSLDYHDRAQDLVARLSASEKASQICNIAPAVSRLGLGNFSYQQEAIHGWFGWPGYSYTVFPMPMAMGATWDPALVKQVGEAISSEARANNHMPPGEKKEFLNAYAPTINLARDPRWGRTEETYTEDPHLLSSMAVAYISGMQGDDAKYLRVSTSAKHFAANNYEKARRYGSSNVDERSLREYYFQAFQAAVMQGHTRSIMSAYNEINGVPCNVNPWLLQEVLRGDWGFDGFVTSDCDDIADTVKENHYVATMEEAAALSVRSGEDQDCGSNEYSHYLPIALFSKHLITEADLDVAARRTFETRLLYGEFDDKAKVPYEAIPASVVNSKEHQELARQVEREAVVLLKNEGNLLPLSKDLKSLAVIGPFSQSTFLGGYSNKKPFYTVTALQGIQAKLPGVSLRSALGCDKEGKGSSAMRSEAVAAAKEAQAVVLVLGTGEKFAAEDRDAENLNLPEGELDLAKKVLEANPRTVVVLCSGHPLSVNWIAGHAPAILESWHGGQEYGNALADVIFGDFNPSGRIAQTCYKDSDKLPPLSDYGIIGKRLYMYADGSNTLYPFGYGLSYTQFEYKNLRLSRPSIKSYESVQASLEVANTGARDGQEVVQIYLGGMQGAPVPLPKLALKAFERLGLKAGETKTLTFTLKGMDPAYYDVSQKRFVVAPGNYEVMAGASSTDLRLKTPLNIGWVEPAFPGFYRIVSAKSGLALEQHAGRLQSSPYFGWKNQKWIIKQVGERAFQIQNLQSGLPASAQSFEVSMGDASAGKPLAGESQWRLVAANDSTSIDLPPDWVKESKVFLKSAEGRYLSARHNNFSLGIDGMLPKAEDLFYLYELKSGKFILKSGLNSKYVGSEPGSRTLSANFGKLSESEVFEMDPKGALVLGPQGSSFSIEPFDWLPKERPWIATASDNPEATEKAFDLEMGTRWDSGRPQRPGMWFQVDLGAPESIKGIVLDSAGSPHDFPKGYRVALSRDGNHWDQVASAEPGTVLDHGGVVDIAFAPAQARYLKITQTGSDKGLFWSIHDLRVRKGSDPDPGSAATGRPWKGSASHNPGAASKAFDLDPSTRWDSGEPQRPGMWYKLDLGASQALHGITLDASGSPTDSPKGYKVEVSSDDKRWIEVAGAAPGAVKDDKGVLEITFPEARARYVKITDLGRDDGLYWSIHELRVQ